jgi:dimethylamine--corrinoid protein Co-methyltransferase
MSIAHIMSAGMCGIRTAGDLVAWMQLTRRMKINDAKQYVAGKLEIAVEDLCNEDVMQNVRQKLNIGDICAPADGVKGMTAKSRIADLLDISINSVNLFKSKLNAPLK